MADSFKGSGFLTGPTSALAVVMFADAVAPLKWDAGFLRDSRGVLVVRSV